MVPVAVVEMPYTMPPFANTMRLLWGNKQCPAVFSGAYQCVVGKREPGCMWFVLFGLGGS